jgi:hypothetical protein
MTKVIEFPNRQENYQLMVEFIDQSHSFAMGFECGYIWAELDNGIPIESKTVNAENREQITKMAEVFEKKAFFDELAEGWLTVTIA